MILFFTVAANEGFKLRSIDIRAALLQARKLDRDVYLMPPKDIRNEGYIWRYKKPLYTLFLVRTKFIRTPSLRFGQILRTFWTLKSPSFLIVLKVKY